MLTSDSSPETNPFFEKMETLEDKELLNVIKNGAEYQPQGVEAAVMIAIKRELISKEEGEKLLGYTFETIKHNDELLVEEVEKKQAKGRVEMILGILLFLAGLYYTVNSTHYIWIGALIFGPILFIRGLFR